MGHPFVGANMNHLTISGYSTALFSTFYFLEEHGILFDAGDGLTAHLMQKARKVKHVFVSHADRDHLAGLLQFMQLNARTGFPKVYYPKDSGSFPALASFSQAFDPHVVGGEWIGLSEGEEVRIKSDLIVKAIGNRHIVSEGQVKSLSFQLFNLKRKLREEWAHLSGKEIGALRLERGEEAISREVREKWLSYSGDTPIEKDGRWADSRILIHEATFIHQDDKMLADPRTHKHSTLEEVLEMVKLSNIGQLILGHFSTRYSHEEIVEAVNRLCQKYQIDLPVDLVLPGQFRKDILAR